MRQPRETTGVCRRVASQRASAAGTRERTFGTVKARTRALSLTQGVEKANPPWTYAAASTGLKQNQALKWECGRSDGKTPLTEVADVLSRLKLL